MSLNDQTKDQLIDLINFKVELKSRGKDKNENKGKVMMCEMNDMTIMLLPCQLELGFISMLTLQPEEMKNMSDEFIWPIYWHTSDVYEHNLQCFD